MQLLNPALRALRTPQKIKADPNISTTPNLRLVSPQATHPTTRLSYSSGADGQARSRNLQSDGQAAGPLDQRDQLTVTFGTGEITGVFLRDDVCIGHLCANMEFIGASHETAEPFGSFDFDGVLGLALPQMTQGTHFSIMDRMEAAGNLRHPIFSVFLSDSDEEDSEITFGDVKEERMVQMEDIAIGNKQQNLCSDCQVAVDTGTSMLAGPSAVIGELTKRLNVAPDCSNYQELPDLGFVVAGHVMNLKPSDYVDKSAGSCSPSLMSLDVPPPNGPLFIFGDPFLRKFYSAYDLRRHRVGFAVARHVGVPEARAQAGSSDVRVHRGPHIRRLWDLMRGTADFLGTLNSVVIRKGIQSCI
ncbi:Pepsin B [Durusdinium trenchii]|uniref:Pepsin B n=1 Tax=Durusdinium trenchii TaxID=1381693 RepID=A0ABP0P7Q8_9DINO